MITRQEECRDSSFDFVMPDNLIEMFERFRWELKLLFLTQNLYLAISDQKNDYDLPGPLRSSIYFKCTI